MGRTRSSFQPGQAAAQALKLHDVLGPFVKHISFGDIMQNKNDINPKLTGGKGDEDDSDIQREVLTCRQLAESYPNAHFSLSTAVHCLWLTSAFPFQFHWEPYRSQEESEQRHLP